MRFQKDRYETFMSKIQILKVKSAVDKNIIYEDQLFRIQFLCSGFMILFKNIYIYLSAKRFLRQNKILYYFRRHALLFYRLGL